MQYPKLRYPIHTKGLSNEDRCILLAYDICYRTKTLEKFDIGSDDNFIHDLDANLANLGHHIETNICGGDMALRFEGYDNMSSEDMKNHFMEKVKRELFTEENESKN